MYAGVAQRYCSRFVIYLFVGSTPTTSLYQIGLVKVFLAFL